MIRRYIFFFFALSVVPTLYGMEEEHLFIFFPKGKFGKKKSKGEKFGEELGRKFGPLDVGVKKTEKEVVVQKTASRSTRNMHEVLAFFEEKKFFTSDEVSVLKKYYKGNERPFLDSVVAEAVTKLFGIFKNYDDSKKDLFESWCYKTPCFLKKPLNVVKDFVVKLKSAEFVEKEKKVLAVLPFLCLKKKTLQEYQRRAAELALCLDEDAFKKIVEYIDLFKKKMQVLKKDGLSEEQRNILCDLRKTPNSENKRREFNFVDMYAKTVELRSEEFEIGQVSDVDLQKIVQADEGVKDRRKGLKDFLKELNGSEAIDLGTPTLNLDDERMDGGIFMTDEEIKDQERRVVRSPIPWVLKEPLERSLSTSPNNKNKYLY
ncbi:MAG: hypothetical protein JW725_03930 [Candidatus Babeliaceae bacterium]|nr:hypothetical protein [Candidatus Babeliaceae bacterium]